MYYRNIDGWCDFEDLYVEVAKSVPNGSILIEVGVWLGRSVCFLAEVLKDMKKDVLIFAVDTWEGSDEKEHKEYIESVGGKDKFYEEFLSNMKAAGVASFVKPVRKPSLDAAKDFTDGVATFIFIDAEHHYQNVYNDIEAWKPKVKSGGMIAGHDHYVGNKDSEGVVLAAKAHFGEDYKFTHSCWYKEIA